MLIKKLITYLMFVFFIITTNTFGLENKILVKIEREIITKIDIENETKYLLALNKNINDLSESEIFEISKNSIIKEKIQNIEIKKNFKDLKLPEKYLEQILESIYQRIGIKDLDTFKNYLKNE
jgi:peptidyl-prolyl cis-trans isomerase SurA